MKSKICSKCKKKKSVDEFYPHKGYRDKRSSWCKSCHSRYHKQEHIKKNKKLYRQKIKAEVINAYGNKCTCCSETILAFLTIDHIYGDGHEHRRKLNLGGGTDFYLWLRKNNYPEGFQVLCFNCNCGRQINGGVCPHQIKEE